MDPEPYVSVVICTHNGAATLGVTLSAIAKQSLPSWRYEVVVVDDASSDNSGAIAMSAGCTVIRREHSSGLAAARNAGLAAAKGALIVFTDDDCEPDTDWMKQLIAPFDDPSVDGVTGLTTTASTRTIEFRYLALRNPLRPLPESILRTLTPRQRLLNYLRREVGPSPNLEDGARVYNLVGANMALRREHIDAVGGLDESFFSSSEEEEMCARIHAHLGGAVFLYQPSARVAHHNRPGFADSLRRARHYGHGNLLFSRHRGTMPIVYPFPVTIGLLSSYLLLRRRHLAPLTLISPVLCYGRWLSAWRQSGYESVVFAYMQFLQEVAFTFGEIQSLLGLRR